MVHGSIEVFFEAREEVDEGSPIAERKVELAVVNGENSAHGGFGITGTSYNDLVSAGADAVTLGNLDQIKNQYSLFPVSAVSGHIV